MNEAMIILVVLFVSVVVFLICREIFCWYWKINNIVKSIEVIEKVVLTRVLTQDYNEEVKSRVSAGETLDEAKGKANKSREDMIKFYRS